MLHHNGKQNNPFRNSIKLLPIAIFILALSFSWVTAFYYANNILDSDASSELVLANLLSKEDAIISQNWIYSNELRVIQTNLVFAPLMKVFSNWHSVRYVGILILQSIMLISYFFMCKQLKLGRNATFYSATMLILPFSIKYGRIVLYHTYYLPFVTIGFILVGILVSFINHQGSRESRIRRWFRISALLLMSLIAGLNGVRQLMVTMLPILLTSFVVTWKKEKSQKKVDSGGLVSKWGLILLSLCVCFMGAIGYYINNDILGKLFTFRHYDKVMTSIPNSDGLTALLYGYFSQFGYQTNRVLFSLPGILAIGGLFVVFFLSLVGVKQFACKLAACNCQAITPDAISFVKILFPFATLVMLTFFLFSGQEAVYYLHIIPAIVWAIPFLACLIEENIDQRISVENMVLTAVCVIILSNGIYNNTYFINPTDEQVKYEGLSWQNVDTVKELKGAVGFLTSNNYEVGYASFWNSNVITEITSGQISMINILIDKDNPSLKYYDWLTNMNYRDESFVEDKRVFILLRIPENEVFLQTPLADYGNLVYDDGIIMIYDFDDYDQPFYALQE